MKMQTAIWVMWIWDVLTRSFQQVVTGVHFDTDRVQSLYNLGNIRYNGILTVGQLGKEMMFYQRIQREVYQPPPESGKGT